MSNDINIIHNYYNLLVYYVYKYCLFYTCNITLTRRRGSRPDGARSYLLHVNYYCGHCYYKSEITHLLIYFNFSWLNIISS